MVPVWLEDAVCSVLAAEESSHGISEDGTHQSHYCRRVWGRQVPGTKRSEEDNLHATHGR